MCYFVTIATAAPLERVRKHFPRGFRVLTYKNPGLSAPFAGSPSFLAIVSDTDCSCALFCPSAEPERARASRIEKLCRKYERLGWSRAKIERALVSARAAALLGQGAGWTGFRPDLRGLLANLAKDLGEIAVLVHEYAGGLEDEAVPVKGRRRIRADEVATVEPAIDEWLTIAPD